MQLSTPPWLQVGSVNNTFGVPGVEENCLFLKDMEHAKAIRHRVNQAFELAALPTCCPEDRERLLTFVIVSCCTCAQQQHAHRGELSLLWDRTGRWHCR